MNNLVGIVCLILVIGTALGVLKMQIVDSTSDRIFKILTGVFVTSVSLLFFTAVITACAWLYAVLTVGVSFVGQ